MPPVCLRWFPKPALDIILLINGLPVAQIELKKLDISPRKAMQQIVD